VTDFRRSPDIVTSIFRHRLFRRSDRVLRGLLLQRDHCVGVAIFSRFVHEHFTMDHLRQRLEHDLLPTGNLKTDQLFPARSRRRPNVFVST